jgi:hypothetical protein
MTGTEICSIRISLVQVGDDRCDAMVDFSLRPGLDRSECQDLKVNCLLSDGMVSLGVSARFRGKNDSNTKTRGDGRVE